ncbi:MAG TPA: proprotein convertase P-domain-containing protein [Pyrinomonadaceae bacterium]|jgi:subtilisin-like proprotein convertase family protein
MKRDHKYWPYLILLVIGVVFSAGYLALAQEQESAVSAQQEQTIDAPQSSTGKSGVATKGSSVNFGELANRQSLLPAVPLKEPKVIREPGGPGPLLKRRAAASVDATNAPQASDSFAEPNAPLVASPAPSSTFKALEDNNTSIPPDTHGAVGPNHLMVVLNTQIRIQNRTGTTISTVSLDSFWAGMPGPWASGSDPSTFDPKVLYDPYNNSWMFTVTADGDEPTSAVLIAVSKTSDPTGLWNRYKVDADSTGAAWADYPSLGFNKNWIVVTVNMFGVSPASGFKRSHIYAFNKASLYAGTGPFKVFQDTSGFTQAPAITYDNALNTMYLIEDWDGFSKLRIRSLGGTAAAPTYSATQTFVTSPATWTFAPANGDDFAPQLGSSNKIQNNDSRIQNVVYRAGSLWCVHTIFLPNSATPTRSAIQWWQLTPAGAIQQRGRIDDSTGAKFYGFPSIAVNVNKDVLIGYSRFSSQQYASANYAFRAGTDAVNTLRTEVVLKSGSAPYYKIFGGDRNRWGDYSSTVVDPVNDTDLWTVQEHAAPVSGGFSRWGTWWGRIKPPSSTPAPFIDLGTVTAVDGNAGDADTIIEPGESGNKLTIQLKNSGNATATAVSGKLTTSTAGVTITAGTQAYPNIAAAGSATNAAPFTFSVASTVPCGANINFTLTVTYTGGGSPRVLTFSVPTGKTGTAVTRSYAGGPVPIPDNTTTGVNISLSIPAGTFTGNISDLNFKIGGTSCTTATGATTVGIDHTWVGDLRITLKSPAGTVVTLMDQAGGVNNSGQNFCNTLLDDDATTRPSIQSITPAQAPYTGTFQPASPLSAFDGQNPNGTWILNVSDRGAIDTGNVRAFSLIITAKACSTTALATPVEIDSTRALAASLSTDGDVGGITSRSGVGVSQALQAISSESQMNALADLAAGWRGDPTTEPYLAALLATIEATPSQIEDEPLRSAFKPTRYSYLMRLLTGS